VRHAQGAPLPDARVVQLGDLGAYAAKPGSKACFKLASEFLRHARLRLRFPGATLLVGGGARSRARA
jgi:hypothetical protein